MNAMLDLGAGVRPPLRCPHCLSPNDVHAGPKPTDAPRPGDLSLCGFCHGIAAFTIDDTGRLALRKATPREEAEFPREILCLARAATSINHLIEMYQGRPGAL